MNIIIFLQGLKWQAGIYIINCELMFIKMINNMSKQGSFTDSCLSHDHNGDIQAHSLSDQAHFKEVIYVDYVSSLAIDLVAFISRDIH